MRIGQQKSYNKVYKIEGKARFEISSIYKAITMHTYEVRVIVIILWEKITSISGGENHYVFTY